jgi:hypothetical protein
MSPHLYRECESSTFLPSRATTEYKYEAFVPSGEEEAPTRPCEGTFVPGGPWEKIPGTNETSTRRQMPDSLVVRTDKKLAELNELKESCFARGAPWVQNYLSQIVNLILVTKT